MTPPPPSVRQQTLNALGAVRRDLTHAARSLAKDRVFALVCVVSLGIGMGAVVALATFGRAIAAPARGIDTRGLTELLVLPQGPTREKAGSWALETWSYPDYRDLRASRLGLSITGWTRGPSPVGEPAPDGTPPGMVPTLYVSANYFSTFGVSLAQGRGFDLATDDEPSAEPRVVVSHGFWRSRMASDPAAVGSSLTIHGVPHVVTGIAPEGFRGHFHFFDSPNALLFLSLERHPSLQASPDARHDRRTDWVRLHARLDPGVDVAQASAQLRATVAGLALRYPETNEFKSAAVEPYASQGAVGRYQSRRAFGLLLGLAGAVLVVVCLNISGMMLVRGATRQRELSIRAALGAGRRRLIQHLFFEAVLLASVGAAASGFVLFGVPAIAGWWIGSPVPEEVDLDATGVAISAALCLIVSVLFGLLPALRFSRPSLTPALKEDAGGGGRQTIRVHRVAAMVQVGIAVPFLVISGVMLDRVRTGDLGFTTDGLAAARLPATAVLQDGGFAARKGRNLIRQAGEVRAVAVADGMPVDFHSRIARVAPAGGAEYASAHVTHVGEAFLETLGVPVLRGRTITAEDRAADAPVAVISAPLAARLFPSTEPVGERVTVAQTGRREREFTVVGVSADFATSQLTTERPQILLPLPEDFGSAVQLIARGAPGDEPKIAAALEHVLREMGVEPARGEVFPGIVIGPDLVRKSFGDLVSESMAMGVVGGIVLLLAALGIVGVVGFMVATRTREIAVRMALGSTRLRTFRLMLTDTVRLVVPGVAAGLLLAAFLVRTLENVMGTPLAVGSASLGFMEPVIYAGASIVAVTAAILAGLPAARRATTVAPMIAMRSE